MTRGEMESNADFLIIRMTGHAIGSPHPNGKTCPSAAFYS